MVVENRRVSAATDSYERATTAIIPVYNGAGFIANAVRSVLQQTAAVAAILVVDDCSTDDTARIVSEMAQKDQRLVLIQNATNRGPAYSRNTALSFAKTPLAAFLDADDEWLPDHIAKAQAAFEKFPDATLVYSSNTDDAEVVAGAMKDARIFHDPLTVLLDTNPITQSATVVKTARIIASGGYSDDARYAEDYDLWVRLALDNCQFVEIPQMTIARTLHADQISFRFAHKMFQSAWNTRRRAIEQRFGSVEQASAADIASVVRAQARDVAAVLNTRRRDLVKLILDLTQWVPGTDELRTQTERLIGWRWPIWRMAAMAYDGLPLPAKNWIRVRRNSVSDQA